MKNFTIFNHKYQYQTINLPHPEINEKEATDMAGKLVRKAWLFYDWRNKPYRKR